MVGSNVFISLNAANLPLSLNSHHPKHATIHHPITRRGSFCGMIFKCDTFRWHFPYAGLIPLHFEALVDKRAHVCFSRIRAKKKPVFYCLIFLSKCCILQKWEITNADQKAKTGPTGWHRGSNDEGTVPHSQSTRRSCSTAAGIALTSNCSRTATGSGTSKGSATTAARRV